MQTPAQHAALSFCVSRPPHSSHLKLSSCAIAQIPFDRDLCTDAVTDSNVAEEVVPGACVPLGHLRACVQNHCFPSCACWNSCPSQGAHYSPPTQASGWPSSTAWARLVVLLANPPRQPGKDKCVTQGHRWRVMHVLPWCPPTRAASETSFRGHPGDGGRT